MEWKEEEKEDRMMEEMVTWRKEEKEEEKEDRMMEEMVAWRKEAREEEMVGESERPREEQKMGEEVVQKGGWKVARIEGVVAELR